MGEIKAITDLVSHRGPDGEGYFLQGNIALGHRRLAILDLSDDGHQPMKYEERYVLTYNGEVYNYIEVREELKLLGYTFVSGTDTEVILAAYDCWGRACVERFNGMWAFVILDRVANEVFMSRDRFGIKPLYFYADDDKFVFGSEIKQLLPFSGRVVDRTILLDFLSFGLIDHSDSTFFKGVRQLKPSHNIVYSLQTHTFETSRYFTIRHLPAMDDMSLQTSVETYGERLRDAVKLRLRSDVRVGTCLSGGLDSSSIATIASRYYRTSSSMAFSAMTAQSVDSDIDETLYASKVVDHAELDWHTVTPSADDFVNCVEDVAYTQEEPFGGPSIVMQHYVMKLAKSIGCTVVLDGQGGDETLIGYDKYFPYYFSSLVRKRSIQQLWADFMSMKTYRLNRGQIVLQTLNTFVRPLTIRMRLFVRNIGEKMNGKWVTSGENLLGLYSKTTFRDYQIREIERLNLPGLLRYEDRNSMRHSIETRLPFLDYRVVETALSIKDQYKFSNGYLKYILRQAMDKELPSDICWRTNKLGFEAPSKIWFEGFRDSMLATIRDSTLLKNVSIDSKTNKDDVLLWRYYTVALWAKVYNVKIS